MIYSTEKLKPLIKLINNLKSKTFSVNTQYKFLKLLKIAKEEQDIVDEQQQIILDNYAEKDANNKFIISAEGGIKIKAEYLDECIKKVNEINNRQIQFPDIYFSLDELENLSLTLEELECLDPFIKN